MIIIGSPEVIQIEAKSRLQCEINIDGNVDIVWFQVDKKFGDYLCYERVDAFVIGILNYAMRNGHDIKCLAPMGEELHYQITTYLIDAVYKGSDKLHKTQITAEIDATSLPNAKAVGTGISCGIDSLHVIATHSQTSYLNHNVTHLAFNNVGSHGEGKRAIELYKARKKQAREFADEYGFEFVESNSNIHDVISQSHFMTHTYTSLFAVLALQKLYSVYYYASGRTIFEFSLSDTYSKDCSYYDFLISCSVSSKSLKVIIEGSTISRLEKTERITTYSPSYKYLNVCTATEINCCKCEKCTRTLLSLDAMNMIDHYGSVFDLTYYKNNIQKYYSRLVYYKLLGNINYVELYPLLKGKINFSSEIIGRYLVARPKLISLMPDKIKSGIKKYLIK